MPADFQKALAYGLAVQIMPKVNPSRGKRADMNAMMEGVIVNAKRSDAMENPPRPIENGGWVTSRGDYDDYEWWGIG
jgi:hypothetical protein